MSRLILLDSGPLGLVTNPRESAETRRCNAWLFGVLAGGSDVLVPEWRSLSRPWREAGPSLEYIQVYVTSDRKGKGNRKPASEQPPRMP